MKSNLSASLEDLLLKLDVEEQSAPSKPKKKKKRTKKRKKKFLSVLQPSPQQLYCYVVLDPDFQVFEVPAGSEELFPERSRGLTYVLALPLGSLGNDPIFYPIKETSILNQGYDRSPSGMTNVENLQVFGDVLLENSITRSRWRQENFQLTSRLDTLPSTYGRFNNTISPTVFCDPCQFSELVYLRKIPFVRSNRTTTQGWAYVLGLKSKGSDSVVLERAWAEDAYVWNITWRVDSFALELSMEASYTSHDSRGPNGTNTPPPDWARERCRYQRFFYAFRTRIEFPPEISACIRQDTLPATPWRQDINVQRDEAASFEQRWYYSEYNFIPGGNPATYLSGCVYLGPAPQWEYMSSYDRPDVDISGLLEKARSTFEYEVGSQSVAMFGSDYAFGNKAGRNRGGSTVYSALQEEAIDTNRYINTNLPMFFADLANAVEDWNNLADQFRGNLDHLGRLRQQAKLSRGDLKGLTQDVANTYLPLKYGWALTQAEAEQIGQSLTRVWEDVRLASEPRYLGPARTVEYDVSTQYLSGLSQAKQTFVWNGTVRPQPNSFSGLFAFLDERSLWLTASDAWDWIPYSFVVNWFFDLPQNGINWLDFQAWKANYDLIEACRSYKLEGRLGEPDLFPNAGNVFVARPPTLTYYIRTWNRRFDPPHQVSSESSVQDRALAHWAELGALIVQRL
jgi:hypothetical protein